MSDDTDALIARLEEADTENLQGYAAVRLGQLLGEAAAAIRDEANAKS